MSVALRNAHVSEAASLAAIEAACWPAAMAADEECFQGRLDTYPEGQWVAERQGASIGVATAQRITAEFFHAGPATYDRLTDGGSFRNSHAADGDVFQLISVSVPPEARGLRLGRRLVDREIAFGRSLPGVRRIIGFTRPAGFRDYADMSIEEYVALRRDDDRYADPVLEFHLGSGARLVSIHPDYRPADEEAGGYGILIEYAV